MNKTQIVNFFADKEGVASPLTDTLINDKGYRQVSGGYIQYAKSLGINAPSQYWHLMRSWADRSEPDEIFSKRIQCGELLFWMVEVSGALTSDELCELIGDVMQYRHADGTYDRTRANNLIRSRCFDKIAETVERACPLG